jgi:hypothetical protein
MTYLRFHNTPHIYQINSPLRRSLPASTLSPPLSLRLYPGRSPLCSRVGDERPQGCVSFTARLHLPDLTLPVARPLQRLWSPGAPYQVPAAARCPLGVGGRRQTQSSPCSGAGALCPGRGSHLPAVALHPHPSLCRTPPLGRSPAACSSSCQGKQGPASRPESPDSNWLHLHSD